MSTNGQRYVPDQWLPELRDHPDNPRRGDDDAVGASIEANGFYGAIVAQEGTGYILAGHTRRRALLAAGQKTGPVIWVDVDAETARRILLADNRTAELAEWDDGKLAGLLKELADQADDPVRALAAAGFSEADLNGYLEGLSIPEPPESLLGRTDRPQHERQAAAERYAETNIRQLVLVMGREMYERMTVDLTDLREEWGMDTLTDVVLRLVGEHT